MLLKVKLIKPDHLLPILNQINHNIQFTMEKSQTFFRYNDKKSGTKNGWIFTVNLWKCPIHGKTSTVSFNKYTTSLARGICTIVENENVKEKRLKELKKTIARTKICQVINRS